MPPDRQRKKVAEVKRCKKANDLLICSRTMAPKADQDIAYCKPCFNHCSVIDECRIDASARLPVDWTQCRFPYRFRMLVNAIHRQI